MPREGYSPISVHEVTKKAVEETRDEFDDFDTYDDVLRYLMKAADEGEEHLDPELREALDSGKRTLGVRYDFESAELIEEDDA